MYERKITIAYLSRTNMMQKIQALIFDIDGTLADSVPLIIAAFRKAVEPLVNRTLTDEEIIAAFGPDEEGSVKAFAPAAYKKGTADFMKYYKEMHGMCMQPFNGMVELLQMLKNKGVRLAVATGKAQQTSDLTLELLKLKPFFEKIENGSPEGSRKIEAIHEILEFFSLPAESVFYVGDSPNDTKESKQAGIKSIAASWSSKAEKDKLKDAHPDELFDTVEDFSAWLQSNT